MPETPPRPIRGRVSAHIEALSETTGGHHRGIRVDWPQGEPFPPLGTEVGVLPMRDFVAAFDGAAHPEPVAAVLKAAEAFVDYYAALGLLIKGSLTADLVKAVRAWKEAR